MGQVCRRSREGTVDLALTAFLRIYWDLLALLQSDWHLGGGIRVQQRETLWGRRQLATPSLYPDMARRLRPLVDNNRLKKKKKANLQTMTKKKLKKTRAIQFAVKAKQALGFLKSWVLKSRKNGLFLRRHLPLKPLERQETSHFQVCDTFCHELALARSEVALLLHTLVVQTHFTKLVFQPKQHSEPTCRMSDTQTGVHP